MSKETMRGVTEKGRDVDVITDTEEFRRRNEDTGGEVGGATFTAGGSIRTGGEVVPLVAQLGLAVQFLLSQLVQQTLVLVLLSRQGCPLLGKVCNAAGAVTFMA